MSVRFKGADLRPVLDEALRTRSHLVLVKDHGVYFAAERGERGPDGNCKNIAYAVGCNPGVDSFDDWWALATSEFGGDDFSEYIDPADRRFTHLSPSGFDLEVSATATHLVLRLVSTAPGKR